MREQMSVHLVSIRDEEIVIRERGKNLWFHLNQVVMGDGGTTA